MMNKLKLRLSANSSIIVLLIIAAAAFILVPGFTGNLSSVILECSIYGFIAVGLSIVMLTGNIDLSIGFLAGLTSVVCLLVLNATGSLALAVLASLCVGAVCGLLNGAVITRLGINPLITTIATCYIYKGLVFAYTYNGSIRPEAGVKQALKSIYGLSLGADALNLTVVLLLAALIILYFVMKRTSFGRTLYVVGDNPEAAKLTGINTSRAVLISYILCGLCCAVAGVFMASRASGAVYTQGDGKDVFAISVCIIGGVKMTGGRGTMISVLTGLLIMRIISTAMNCMLVPSAWVDLVSGLLLIIVLFFDKLTSNKLERK